MAGPRRSGASAMTLDTRFALSRGTFELNVDLSINEGEVVAVMGPNGSGKSTFLHAITGLLPVTSGSLVLDDQTLDEATTEVFIDPTQRPVGIVFQGGLLFETMTILENIIFGLRARKIKRTEATVQAQPLINQFGLSELLQRQPRELSGGQAQRVAIARALITKPKVLLLDEPMSGLDTATRQLVRAEFREVLAGFAGYRILVTHDLDDALAMADRIIELDQGKVIWDGPTSEYRGKL
jgi:molybdate transport system ATP-binding protein